MKKLSWFLGLSCCWVLVFPQAGMAQYNYRPGGTEILNPYNPNNIWMRNTNMIVQGALTRRIAERGRAAQGTTQAPAQATPAKVNQPAETPYVKARHQYKPSKNSSILGEVVKGMNLDETNEREIKAALNLAMRMLKAEAKKRGRQGNISFAVAVLLGSAYSIFYAEEFEDRKIEPVSKTLDQILGRTPQLDGTNNADKQKLAEGYLIASALLLGIYQTAIESQNFNAIEETKLAMRQLLEPLGMDEKNLKLVLEQMSKGS